MIKLTKREWDTMKRPVFPDIQIVTSENNIQIQTMIEAKRYSGEGFKYYAPMVLLSKVNNLAELSAFVEEVSEIGVNMEILSEIDENDNKLYKVSEV